MKKLFLFVMLATALFVTVSCSNPSSDEPESINKVGICLPTDTLIRWENDGNNMKHQLESAGYTVDLRFADNGNWYYSDTQIAQISAMIAANYKVIIIAAIDGNAMTDCLADAKSKGIKIICYDRLIMNTDAVSYFITFDNRKVGVHQGEYIENVLNLKTAPGPLYMEFFTGDAGDPNVPLFFGGAMSVLEPYINSGKIVCLSNQKTWSDCATPSWDSDNAKTRMAGLITSKGYGPDTEDQRLDAVLCSNDSTAQGVIEALKTAGYTYANMPVITGQDCDLPSVKMILSGEQSMSMFRSTDVLVSKTVDMVKAILTGATVPVNDTTTYNNGTGNVNSYLCDSIVVTEDNWVEVLIDSGFYTIYDFID